MNKFKDSKLSLRLQDLVEILKLLFKKPYQLSMIT